MQTEKNASTASSALKLRQKKPDPHRLSGRVSVRLTDEDYALLMERIKADGCSTNQEWLSNLIHEVVHNERNI